MLPQNILVEKYQATISVPQNSKINIDAICRFDPISGSVWVKWHRQELRDAFYYLKGMCMKTGRNRNH